VEDAASESSGLRYWQLYLLGRHGVVGDVVADVVSAVAYVFPPAYLRAEWEEARAVMSPAEALLRYTSVCHDWGRTNLGDFADAARLADLAARIVAAVEVAGLPLFAGWRAVDRPREPAERCAQLMHVLREHRGACHGVALVASGMSPLMAILTNQGGVDNALEYGWRPPFPEITAGDQRRREEAETLTDALVAPPYAALSTGERVEFVHLLEAAFAHCFGK
jgi:hypothetical protein